MLETETCAVPASRPPQEWRKRPVPGVKCGSYILILIAVAIASWLYDLRAYGIFSCQASGYGADSYLSYCNSAHYGDYDHGAMWFNLEPSANTAARDAHVLFLGNSRIQFAFSSLATASWFSSLSKKYYLLGFSHDENYTFEGPLLRKLHNKAKVYVINVDSFFEQSETPPAQMVMRDESALGRYKQKGEWQKVHRAICTAFRGVCGGGGAFFRSRSTGTWQVTGGPFPAAPVSYDDTIDVNKLTSYKALGQAFLPNLPIDRACTILTIVPTVKTEIGTGNAVAAALGLTMVSPRLSGLATFDEVHLDRKSAERWSAAFFDKAGPQIRQCLSE